MYFIISTKYQEDVRKFGLMFSASQQIFVQFVEHEVEQYFSGAQFLYKNHMFGAKKAGSIQHYKRNS